MKSNCFAGVGRNLLLLMGSVGSIQAQDFGAAVSYAIPALPGARAVGDLNNDGRPDLLTSSPGTSKVTVRLGQTTGGSAAPVDYSVGFSPAGIVLADFDLDGPPWGCPWCRRG